MHLTDLVMIVLSLLGVGVLVAGIFRRLPIPYTVMLVVVGVTIRLLAQHVPIFAEAEEFSISPDLVLFIFLPVLIFDSAAKLNARQLLKDIIPVVTLAVPALFLSAFFIAACLHFIFRIDFMTALIFGALISATDPVAVVALFKELGAPARLTILLEGESLLNDASAIVLFTLCLTLLTQHLTLDAQTFVFSVGTFFKVFVGGGIIGALAGLILSLLNRMLRFELQELMIAVLVLAYFSFIVAEHYLHVSGVMAVLGAGIVSACFIFPRLSQDDAKTINETWDFLAMIANTLLFLLMGLTINIVSLIDKAWMILAAYIAVCLARGISIYGILPWVQSAFKVPRVSQSYRHVMWWGGLKGGLALAMVLSIPTTVPGQQLLLDLTLGVVLLTLVINAPTIKPLMRFFRLSEPTEHECIEIAHSQEHAQLDAELILHELEEAKILSRATYSRLDSRVKETFKHDHLHNESGDEVITAIIKTLHQEGVVLKGIYEAGMIGQYNYLELTEQLQRQREYALAHGAFLIEKPDSRGKWFDKIEQKIIAYFRESNWGAFLLAHYQNLRQSELMTRVCVHILMLMHAKERLANDKKVTPQEYALCEGYLDEELGSQTSTLFEIRAASPEFYRRFIKNFAFRSALANAKANTSHAYNNAVIGAKSYHEVTHDIDSAISKLPSMSQPVRELTPQELIRLLPSCGALTGEPLDMLALQAQTIKFLPGDVVISQGDKGDALYIIANGEVEVVHRDSQGNSKRLAYLHSGDIIGEMALLGDSLRQATVIAMLPSTLLRITRDDVLEAAKTHPVLLEILEALKQQRKA